MMRFEIWVDIYITTHDSTDDLGHISWNMKATRSRVDFVILCFRRPCKKWGTVIFYNITVLFFLLVCYCVLLLLIVPY